MPNSTNLSGYRFANGTLSTAGLTATYAIEAFPDQGDQRNVPWTRPQSRADVVQPVALQQALDNSLLAYGGIRVEWEFPWLSPGMMDYIYDTKLGGAYSAAVTIRTWDRLTNSWRTLNGTGQWPAPDVINGLRNVGGGFENFPIVFVGCVAAS